MQSSWNNTRQPFKKPNLFSIKHHLTWKQKKGIKKKINYTNLNYNEFNSGSTTLQQAKYISLSVLCDFLVSQEAPVEIYSPR